MAQGRKTKLVICLTAEGQRELESWQRSTTIPVGLARRGRIILLLSAGAPVSRVARTVGIQRPHVYKWARRFLEQGIEGLRDKLGRGRKASFSSGGGRSLGEDGRRAARVSGAL